MKNLSTNEGDRDLHGIFSSSQTVAKFVSSGTKGTHKWKQLTDILPVPVAARSKS
jgi:hypothetical protein